MLVTAISSYINVIEREVYFIVTCMCDDMIILRYQIMNLVYERFKSYNVNLSARHALLKMRGYHSEIGKSSTHPTLTLLTKKYIPGYPVCRLYWNTISYYLTKIDIWPLEFVQGQVSARQARVKVTSDHHSERIHLGDT